MARLKLLILEIHRRSLWQVLTVYVGASWAVMEATDQVVARYLLPEWVYPAALILLLIGLPIVLATALVREEKREPEPVAEVRDPTLLGDVSQGAARPSVALARKPVARMLTWPRAILGGVLAFTVLGLVSALIVVRGNARVAEAHGMAGDAFEERAWIVVADFEAAEDEAETALAAQTALTVDLQQSKYVNVRSRNQIAPVLARMGLPDTVQLGERLALEVAQREGLAAVLAATISRLGNDYVLGARVIEPQDLNELIAVRSVVGQDRLIEGVETLSRELRSRLGEERELIRQSKALPAVTTSSLAALKKFAQARAANELGDYDRTVKLADEAIRLDSSFAMAYSMASIAHSNARRIAEARAYSNRAYELRDRLPDRERLHLEADYNWTVLLEPRRVLETYEVLLSQYPDDGRASNNLGVIAGVYLGDYERAYRAYRSALDVMPSPLTLGNAITLSVGTGRAEGADSLIRRANEGGHRLVYLEGQIERSFVQEDWMAVETFCDSLLAETVSAAIRADNQRYCGSIDVARGRLHRGIERLEEAGRYFADTGQYTNLSATVNGIVLGEGMRRGADVGRARLGTMLSCFRADSIGEPDRSRVRAELIVLAGLLDLPELLDRIASTYPPYPDSTHWIGRYTDGLAGAAEGLVRGEPAQAIERLRHGTASGYKPFYWLPLTDLLFGLAFDGLGQVDSAVAHLEAAAEPTNLAVSPFALGRLYLPIVLRRLAELEESRGNSEAAIRHYQRFLELWSGADPELQGDVDAARRPLARLTGEVTN